MALQELPSAVSTDRAPTIVEGGSPWQELASKHYSRRAEEWGVGRLAWQRADKLGERSRGHTIFVRDSTIKGEAKERTMKGDGRTGSLRGVSGWSIQCELAPARQND